MPERGPASTQRLQAFERRALEVLLRGEPELLARIDRHRVQSREFTGAGLFVTLALPDAADEDPKVRPWPRSSTVELRHPRLQHGAGGVVWATRTRIDGLELFTYAEPWPEVALAWCVHEKS